MFELIKISIVMNTNDLSVFIDNLILIIFIFNKMFIGNKLCEIIKNLNYFLFKRRRREINRIYPVFKISGKCRFNLTVPIECFYNFVLWFIGFFFFMKFYINVSNLIVSWFNHFFNLFSQFVFNFLNNYRAPFLSYN
jgi:hypothetical protein